nr:DNA-directed RNA polymerase V subunit 5A-like isoform X1 [Coffea arabica]
MEEEKKSTTCLAENPVRKAMDVGGKMEMDVDGESYPRCLSSYIDEGSIESHRYYLSRRTVLEMLRDRGFLVPNSEIGLSLQDFRNNYGQQPDIDRLRISALHKDDPSNKILVLFCGPNVVKVNVIRGIANQIMNKDTLSRLILIVQNHITSQAMKAVDLLPFKVEIFQITDLLVNVTKHVLKPKHQLLTEEEKQRLLEKYNIEDKQLPRMLQKDAIARYYGLEKGQVLKVTYNNEITETHVTYRCVW